MTPDREQDQDQQQEIRLCRVGEHRLRDDELSTCLACINRVRTVLLEVVEAFDRLPDAVRVLSGISYDHAPAHGDDGPPLPGGDAIALMAGGTFGGVTSSRSGDRSHAQDQHETDPPSVAAVLASIEDDWRAFRRDGAAPFGLSVHRSADYLKRHLRWAAEVHPAFLDHRAALLWLHARVQTVTGDHERPEAVAAPCMHCGGRIIREWTTAGLSDQLRCEKCDSTWEHDASYRLAQRAVLEELPATHPDLPVTAPEAKRILRPVMDPKTVEARVRRGMVAQVGHNVRGEATYRLADLAPRRGTGA